MLLVLLILSWIFNYFKKHQPLESNDNTGLYVSFFKDDSKPHGK